MDLSRPLSVVAPSLDGDVLAVLARADGWLTGRQIHRLAARGSEAGIRNAADRLVGQGLVLREPAGRAHNYRLNREHLAAPSVERLAGLREELFARLRAAIGTWDEPPLAALVFGSTAIGTATLASDLDILVVRRAGADPDDHAWHQQIDAVRRQASSWTGNDVRVLEVAEEELEHGPPEPVVEAAVTDGIELVGSLSGVRRLVRRQRP